MRCKPLKSLEKSTRPRNEKRDRKNLNDSAHLERPHVRKGSQRCTLSAQKHTCRQAFFHFFFFFFHFIQRAFINGRRLDYVYLHLPTSSHTNLLDGVSKATRRSIVYDKLNDFNHLQDVQVKVGNSKIITYTSIHVGCGTRQDKRLQLFN